MKQRGAALISALAVVAVLVVITTAATTRQQLEIRRTANMLKYDQMRVLAESMDAWAIATITAKQQDTPVTTLNDAWREPLELTDVGQGTVRATIHDLQSRFNLNTLVAGQKVRPESLARFSRLLKQLDLPEELAPAVLDWIDDDNMPRERGGAEVDTYLQKTPAYRPANRPISDPRELLLIEGVDASVYATLAPHVTALPETAGMNVNTVSRELLASLSQRMTQSDVETLIEGRTMDPWDNITTFLEHQALAGLEIQIDGLQVSSDYFLLSGEVTFDNFKMKYASIIHRTEDNRAEVIQRYYGSYEGN